MSSNIIATRIVGQTTYAIVQVHATRFDIISFNERPAGEPGTDQTIVATLRTLDDARDYLNSI